MELAAIDQEQAATIVAVLGAVATARGTEDPTPANLAVIRASARHFLGGAIVPESLAASIPGEVAERMDTVEARRLTLNLASVLTFAGPGESDDAEYLDPVRSMIVDDLARYLRVSALEVIELRRVSKQHRDRIAFDRFRRFPLRNGGETASTVDGALDRSESGLHIDARRVHALWERIEGLPSGTVGSELTRYYRDNGWSYPGTDHHQPLTNAVHDFHHVLGGYATSVSGELQLGAFTAGAANRPMDGALVFLLGVQLGVGTPWIPDPGDAFESVPFFAALERGAATTGAFTARDWDPWAIVERRVDELRAEYEIGPGAQLATDDAYHRDPVNADH